MNPLKKQDLQNTDLAKIPDGANIIYDGKAPVAIIMSIKYYAKLQALIKQVKELMGKKK